MQKFRDLLPVGKNKRTRISTVKSPDIENIFANKISLTVTKLKKSLFLIELPDAFHIFIIGANTLANIINV